MSRPAGRRAGALLAAVIVAASGCNGGEADRDGGRGRAAATAPETPRGDPAVATTPELPHLAVSNAGGYVVAYRCEPEPIPLNEPFSLEVAVRRAGSDGSAGPAVAGAVLEVDGRMPHHQHGMNQVPQVVGAGPGRFLVTDMLFHMPGRWELHFDVTEDGITERTQCTVVLE